MEIKSLSTLLEERKNAPRPEPRKCNACPTMVDAMRTEFGWYMPSHCAPCIAKIDAESRAEEEARRRRIAKELLALPPRFQRASFETFKKEMQPVAYEAAEQFVAKYKPGKAGRGLYLFGHPGSGKTHLAAAIAGKLMLTDSTRFISSPELLLNIKKSFNSDARADTGLLDKLSRTHLLVIDDLGSEKPTEWVQETLFVLIDRRYTHYVPTIITSNFSLDELKQRLGYRIASRIAEMCDVVELQATDYRIRRSN